MYVDQKPELHPLKTTKNVDGREVQHKEEKLKKKEAKKDKAAAAAADAKPAAAPVKTAPSPEGKVHLIVRMSVPVRNQTAWTAMVGYMRRAMG